MSVDDHAATTTTANSAPHLSRLPAGSPLTRHSRKPSKGGLAPSATATQKMEQFSKIGVVGAAIVFMFCVCLIAYGAQYDLLDGLRPQLLSDSRSDPPAKTDIDDARVHFMYKAWEMRRSSINSIETLGFWPDHVTPLDFFSPIVVCKEQDRLVNFERNGVSVCDLSRLRSKAAANPENDPNKRCVIYLIGDNPDQGMSVESALLDATDSNCDIHTYEPCGKRARLWRKASRLMVYHAGELSSIAEEMTFRNHKRIDLMIYYAYSEDYSLLEKAILNDHILIDQLIVVLRDQRARHPWYTFGLVNTLENADMYQFTSERTGEDSKNLGFVNVTRLSTK